MPTKTPIPKCSKKLLQTKIKKNIEEFKKGRFKSVPQAIAVSYSEVKKRKKK